MISEIPGSADVTLINYDHEQCVIQEPMWIKRLPRYKPHVFYRAGDVTEALLRIVLRTNRNG
jgi:hypothetical protein